MQKTKNTKITFSVLIGSVGRLPAEEVKGHGRQEGGDALLVMQVEGNHLPESLGELCLHQHDATGALLTHKHRTLPHI